MYAKHTQLAMNCTSKNPQQRNGSKVKYCLMAIKKLLEKYKSLALGHEFWKNKTKSCTKENYNEQQDIATNNVYKSCSSSNWLCLEMLIVAPE